MKKFFATVILFALVMCTSLARAAAVDIDLTKMSSTMVYSTVFNMVNNPAKFVGKTMRMRGEYTTYHISINDPTQIIHACIVRDAAGCCSQGLEFVLTDKKYPTGAGEITVVGTISVQKISGKYVCYLKDSALE
ncbi:MAG: hypothetical protein IJG32_03420 [Selenomonadaceae bacterium]|nr:hypothetical protein [Selenomonadaceae bacterium]